MGPPFLLCQYFVQYASAESMYAGLRVHRMAQDVLICALADAALIQVEMQLMAVSRSAAMGPPFCSRDALKP